MVLLGMVLLAVGEEVTVRIGVSASEAVGISATVVGPFLVAGGNEHARTGDIDRCDATLC
jgi:Ca2+/Na+ antiporter